PAFSAALPAVTFSITAPAASGSSWTPKNPLCSVGTRGGPYGGGGLRGVVLTTPTATGSAPGPATATQFPTGASLADAHVIGTSPLPSTFRTARSNASLAAVTRASRSRPSRVLTATLPALTSLALVKTY